MTTRQEDVIDASVTDAFVTPNFSKRQVVDSSVSDGRGLPRLTAVFLDDYVRFHPEEGLLQIASSEYPEEVIVRAVDQAKRNQQVWFSGVRVSRDRDHIILPIPFNDPIVNLGYPGVFSAQGIRFPYMDVVVAQMNRPNDFQEDITRRHWTQRALSGILQFLDVELSPEKRELLKNSGVWTRDTSRYLGAMPKSVAYANGRLLAIARSEEAMLNLLVQGCSPTTVYVRQGGASLVNYYRDENAVSKEMARKKIEEYNERAGRF
jgi:hypothetical protein